MGGECLQLEDEEDERIIKSEYTYEVISREGAQIYSADIQNMFKFFEYIIPEFRAI